MGDLTVSVAMAAYNGEKYIAEQIESILPQLKEFDELVVSINPSTDRTEEIVKEYQNNDSRIILTICKNPGILANFENAIRQCKNEIIFLSDQDDVWVKDKIEKQLKIFKDKSIGGVCHGCIYIDNNGYPTAEQPEIKLDKTIRVWDILKKNPIQGCTLAFRRELTDLFLPFPSDIPMHDSWIGIILAKHSKINFICDRLILYRQHEDQKTSRKHKSLFEMLSDRIQLYSSFIQRTRKIQTQVR